VQTPTGAVPVALGVPPGDGPWPGVVVIHDAAGMTTDLMHQTRWLAEAGFVSAAPDLLRGGTIGRCLRDIVRDYSRWEGTVFDQIEAVRAWLAAREDCTGRVGVIGFCMGGGFALALAPRGGFAAASANYGRRDRSLRDAANTLRRSLEAAGVVHDVQEYPDAGHGFMNDHAPGEVPIIFQVLGATVHTAYHEPSARDARRRITAFFTEHLSGGDGEPGAA
jgi:carboxymethylenebutenolidase